MIGAPSNLTARGAPRSRIPASLAGQSGRGPICGGQPAEFSSSGGLSLATRQNIVEDINASFSDVGPQASACPDMKRSRAGQNGASSKRKGSGSNSAANRVISSPVTLISPPRYRAPRSKSSSPRSWRRHQQFHRNYFSTSESSIAGHWRSKFLSRWRPCLSKASTLCNVSGQVNAV
jgi:hypothetical protein